MANERIGAQVEIEYKSVGEMRKAIKDATGDVLRLQQQFGATSKEAIEAAKRAADLKDRVKEAAEVTDLFDPGNKFKALGNTVQLAANGFAALQGAIGLFGVKSEEVEKQLLKVQSALALSQGLSALADGAKEFERLKVVAVNALGAIKKAIGATGIGLLVVAVGSLVAYWDDIKEAVFGVSEAQKELNEESKKNLEVQQEKLKAIDAQDNVLKLQGKTEKQILQIKQAQTKEAIAAAEINLANAVQTQKIQTETARRNKEILTGILNFITTPTRFLTNQISKIAEFFTGKKLNFDAAFAGTNEAIANFFFDPEETRTEGQKTVDEAQAVLDELKNRYAGYQLQIIDIDKKAADERKKVTKETEEINLKERLGRINQEAEYKIQFDEDFFKQQLPRVAEREQQLTATEEAGVRARILQAQIEKEQRLMLLGELGAGIGAFANLVGRQTAAGKVLGIAEATINTFVAATKSLRADYSAFGPFAIVAKIAAFTTTIATGLSAVRSIARTPVPGAGGGVNIPSVNTSAPVQAQLTPQAQTQALNANAINNLGNQALRAYIVNADLQNQNQINALLQRNASVG